MANEAVEPLTIGTPTTLNIFGMAYRIKMVWIDAQPIATNVI